MDIRGTDDLLNKRDYNGAYKKVIQEGNTFIEQGDKNDLVNIFKKYLWLVNKTTDDNRSTLFCNRLMDWCLENGLEIQEYVEQSRLLNEEMRLQNSILKEQFGILYALHPTNALQVILYIFENASHSILSKEPTREELMLMTTFAIGKESDYESNIEALNTILKMWKEKKHRFKGKLTKFPDLSCLDKLKMLIPALRSLSFLHWICDQASLHDLKVVQESDTVMFVYQNESVYKAHKLPTIREHSYIQSAMRSAEVVAEQRFDWSLEKIDYDKIIEVKPSGDDFRLKVNDRSFMESFKRAAQEAYRSHIQVMESSFITNLDSIILPIGFNCFEAMIFYYCLKSLAIIYYEATKFFIKKHGKFPIAPYLALSIDDLSRLMLLLLKGIFKKEINKSDLEKLVTMYSFGLNGIDDLYFKPVLQTLEGIIIIPSIFVMNNFPKTFLHHLNRLGVKLEDKGDEYESRIKFVFSENGFNVFSDKYPYSYHNGTKTINGDIDVIVHKDNHLFLGQLKNRLEPIEPRDYLKVETKIRKGAHQAIEAVSYVMKNKDEFCAKIGITVDQLESMTIQPFVLMNCLYGSGYPVKGVPVIDTSSLLKFFDGIIRAFNNKGEVVFERKIRTQGEVQPEEFRTFLFNPYFLDDTIYVDLYQRHSFPIRDRRFVIGPETEWSEKFRDSFAAQAIIAHANLVDESQ